MDPVTQALLAIETGAKAVIAVCEVLKTPEGQAAMKQWRENGERFNRVVDGIGGWFEETFQFGVTAELVDGKPKLGVTAKGGRK